MEKMQIYRMADKSRIWHMPIVPALSAHAVEALAEDFSSIISSIKCCEIRQKTNEEYTHHRCANHDAYVYWMPDVLRLPLGYRG